MAEVNVSYSTLNLSIFVVSIIIFLVADLILINNWPIVDHTALIPPNYIKSMINADILNGWHAINADNGFRFFQFINFYAHCSTDTIFTHPYTTWGKMHII